MTRRILLTAMVGAVAVFGADISGVWDFEVETAQGSGNPVFTFKQDGEKLTGTYEGLLGKAAIAGTLKGSAVEWSFQADAGGQQVKVKYSGTVGSATSMQGKADIGELGQATWKASKRN